MPRLPVDSLLVDIRVVFRFSLPTFRPFDHQHTRNRPIVRPSMLVALEIQLLKSGFNCAVVLLCGNRKALAGSRRD